MASQDDSSSAQKEIPEEGSWWQSWGKSFVESVKEKTSTTVEMVQKDLSEFYQTIQLDTATVVVDTASKVQEKIQVSKDEDTAKASFKQGISSILTTVSQSLKTLTQDDTSYSSEEPDGFNSAPVYDRREMKIQAIQRDVGTYCNEPEGLKEFFTTWLESFDFDAKRSEMSDLLVKKPEIRAMYSRLVPTVVSHSTFWQRYFYRIHLFEMNEERTAALVARADSTSLHEEEYNWDSDEGDDNVDDQPVKPASEVVTKVQVHGSETDVSEIVKHGTSVSKSEDDFALCTTGGDKTEEGESVAEDELCKEEDTKESCKEANVKEISEVSCVDDSEAGELGHEYQRTMSDSSSPCKDSGSSTSSSVEVIHIISDGGEEDPKDSATSTNEQLYGSSRTGLGHLNKVKSVDSASLHAAICAHDRSETSSTGSWVSVDDEIRVRRSKKEKIIDGKDGLKSPESNRDSGSSSSSAVIVEKAECKPSDEDENGDDDEDDEFDLDEDVNEEELQKIMQKIKEKSGDLDDDDDWEDWE